MGLPLNQEHFVEVRHKDELNIAESFQND